MDDMLIVVRNKTHVQKLKSQLKKEFDIKNLGEAKKILGREITRDRSTGRLWLSRGTVSLGVGEIQHGRSKTCHYSFGRSLQIILQVVSIITERGGGDVSSTIC